VFVETALEFRHPQNLPSAAELKIIIIKGIFTGRLLFPAAKQQCQSTEDKAVLLQY